MILIVISLFFAIAHGAALPGAMYVFGDLTNLYVNYDISQRVFRDTNDALVQGFSNITFNDSANGTITTLEQASSMESLSPDLILTQDNLTDFALLLNNETSAEIAGNVSCLVVAFARSRSQSIYETLRRIRDEDQEITPSDDGCDCLEQLFRDFSTESRCLTDDTFINGEGGADGILWIVYLFLIITFGVFIAAYIQISFMQAACERQVQKIRLLYYRSVLRQDIGWFDLNPSGEVSSRLNELVIVVFISLMMINEVFFLFYFSDVNKIHEGIGDKFAILVQWVATFFVAFAIGFARDWRMTLFLLGVTPFLAIVAGVFSKVCWEISWSVSD